MHSRAPAYWILVASLLFATMSALVKVAAAGVSLPEIVLFRTLPSAIALFAMARIQRRSMATRHVKLYAMRSFFGICGMFSAFYAVSRLPLATATTLEYTTPLFMLAYIVVLARRHLTRQMAFAMIGGFGGVVIVLRPTLEAGQALAFFAGLFSGAVAAIVYTLIRRLGDAGEPAWRIVLWYSVSGTIVAGAAIPFSPPSNYTLPTVLALLGVGLVGLLGQLAMTRAFSTGPTTLLASLQYSTVGFAAVYGVLIWRDTLSATSAFGLSLIVLSGIVALRRSGRPIQVDT